jgi:hypothetical protein
MVWNRWLGRSLRASALFVLAAACSSGDDKTDTNPLTGTGGNATLPGAGTGGMPNMIGSPMQTGSGGSATPGGQTTGGGGMAAMPTGGGSGMTGGTGNPMMGDAGDVDPMTDGGDMTMEPDYHDPGAGEWEVVPKDQVMSVCKLDTAKLDAVTLPGPFLIVRYGKMCYMSAGADNFVATEAWSTTKTLGALVAGLVSYQTRDIPRTGKKTGQFLDTDRADDWLDVVPYNAEAHVAHVLAMVAHDASLDWGSKSFAYDTVGTTEINSISDMMNNAIAQDTARMGANVEEFTQKFLYEPLGMKNSTWSTGSANKVLAYTWSVDLKDMARVGVLILHYGMWSGQRLVDHEWIYRMTHPSFEDANTGFGYLTWLNSSSNWTSISGGKMEGAGTPGTCAPVCLHAKYPHGLSEATDCNYNSPYTCDQQYDVGVWQAEGLGGQIIQGHRGLDMVVVGRDEQPGGAGPGTAHDVWEAVKGAVIAGDPMFKGDETAFCEAYGKNNYAPDFQ